MPYFFVQAKEPLPIEERIPYAIQTALEARKNLVRLISVCEAVSQLSYCGEGNNCPNQVCLEWIMESFKADLTAQLDELNWALKIIKEAHEAQSSSDPASS